MAAPTGGHVYRNALVTVETVEYANQFKTALLTPTTPTQTYRTLVPDGVVNDVDSAAWTFQVVGLQINRTGGFAHVLRTMTPGDIIDVVLAPHNASGEDKATFEMVVQHPPFGGTQGAWGEIDITFQVNGQPVFTAIT